MPPGDPRFQRGRLIPLSPRTRRIARPTPTRACCSRQLTDPSTCGLPGRAYSAAMREQRQDSPGPGLASRARGSADGHQVADPTLLRTSLASTAARAVGSSYCDTNLFPIHLDHEFCPVAPHGSAFPAQLSLRSRFQFQWIFFILVRLGCVPFPRGIGAVLCLQVAGSGPCSPVAATTWFLVHQVVLVGELAFSCAAQGRGQGIAVQS